MITMPERERHVSAYHRYQRHDGVLTDCGPCNRPVGELVAARTVSHARMIGHPDNQRDQVLAELARWYLADLDDITAGRPLSYVPDLP